MSLVKKNYEVVAEELEKMIGEGVLEPGTKLSTIDQLAQQYGVGKSTIREALTRLKAKGLIEAKQGEGTYIKKDAIAALKTIPPLIAGNREELEHLLQVRKIVESGCAELAAQYHDNSDIEVLEDIINKMAASISNEEMSRIYDIHFHTAIAQATKNPFLQKMMESMSEAMNHTIRDTRNLWLYNKAELATRLYQEHYDIFLAIKARDAAKAKRMIEQHLSRVEKAMGDHLL
jgi:GntR family transcriptional regulator, transcriptional repressor for pyruvate dehydrogenase complex